jgi:glycosyltransferase involved in cell wall biosynthesis
MKVALISTVYNEERSMAAWISGLRRQTMRPDEFVVVDGGSKDRTAELIKNGFDGSDFPKPRVIVQRCNIAEGRNIAIRNTTADVIASIDGGSDPHPRWLQEITQPLRDNPRVQAVGGFCPMVLKNDLHKKIERTIYWKRDSLPVGADCNPSSRNIAYRRAAWEAIGGYPEWLTFAGEDQVFNLNMQFAGFNYYYQPSALVTWEARPDLRSYLKMRKSYGVGAAEARFGTKIHLRWLVSTIFPPVMLLSQAPFADLPFRYMGNAAASFGWIKGLLFGRRPPKDWQWTHGILASPQAFATVQKKSRQSQTVIAPNEKFA